MLEDDQKSNEESRSDKHASASENAASRRRSSSKKRYKTKSSRSSTSQNGGSRSKRRQYIKWTKQGLWILTYGGIMLMTVQKMMDEKVLEALWYNLAALVLLWIFRVLTHQKISKSVIVKAPWLYSHLALVVVHVAVAVFFDAPTVLPSEHTPQYEQPNYVPPEEE